MRRWIQEEKKCGAGPRPGLVPFRGGRRFGEDNNVFVCALGREKIGGGDREKECECEREREAIVVIMIPLGSEGWAEPVEGWR